MAALRPALRDRLRALAGRAARHLEEWQVPDEGHAARLAGLRDDWAQGDRG